MKRVVTIMATLIALCGYLSIVNGGNWKIALGVFLVFWAHNICSQSDKHFDKIKLPDQSKGSR